MFGKGFKSAKCKTALRLAVSRIKLLRNKRDIQLKQMRRDVAQLLQSGQETSARIRVEHVIREQSIMAAYEIIELFCELLVARLPIIDSQKNCPIDLREAVSSLIFAAPRCADIPELLDIRSHFGSKYGKEFIAAAAELRPDCGVNRIIIEKLSARAPGGEVKLKIMKEIAKEHQVNWDTAESEAELLKLHEDLLDGASKFAGATNMHAESEKDRFHPASGQKYGPDTHFFHQNASRMLTDSIVSPSGSIPLQAPSMPKSSIFAMSSTSSVEDLQHESGTNLDSFAANGNVRKEQPPQPTSSVKNMKPADLRQKSFSISSHSLSMGTSNTLDPDNVPVGKYDSSGQSDSHRMETKNRYLIGEPAALSIISNEIGSQNRREWNMNFKDAASAAQAAAYSAEKASEAARVAADLSNQSRFLNKGSMQAGNSSFGSSSTDEHTTSLNDSRMSRKPHSNDFLENEMQAERRKSHQIARWQSSRQEEADDIGAEYELPMKRTSTQDLYQQPLDRVSHNNHPIVQKSPHIRRDGKPSSDGVGGLNMQDTDVNSYVGESPPWRRETMYPHSNFQPLDIFEDAISMNAESGEEMQMKRYGDSSRSEVNMLPRFDDSSHDAPSDFKCNPQNTENDSTLKSNSASKIYNHPSVSSPALQTPKWSPPVVSGSYQAKSESLFSNNNSLPKKYSTQAGDASFSSSSSDEEMSNLNDSTMRRKPSSNDFVQNENRRFDASDRFGRHSVEANAKKGKSPQSERQQKETGDISNEYKMSMKRTGKFYTYHQPSNGEYCDDNMPTLEKPENIRGEEKHNFVSGGSLNMKDTDGGNSVQELLSRRGEMMDPSTSTQSSEIFDDSDSMNSDSDGETQLGRNEVSHRSKVNNLPYFDGASSDFKSWSRKNTEHASALKSSSVSEAHNQPYQSSPAVQPHKGFAPAVSVSSQASSQSSLGIGEPEAPKEKSLRRGSHVHPKLPEYDDLAARFESMKSNKQ